MAICSPSVMFKSHRSRTLSILALLATAAFALLFMEPMAVDASGVPPAFLTPPTVKMIVGTLNTYMPVVNDNLVVVEQGPLPNDVTFTNGSFSGTPDETGTYNVVLQAVSASDPSTIFATQDFKLVVANFGVVPESIPTIVPGSFYQLQLQEAGASGPVTWKAKLLPKGLTISHTTGLVSGTPSPGLNPGIKKVKVTVVVVGKKDDQSSAKLLLSIS